MAAGTPALANVAASWPAPLAILMCAIPSSSAALVKRSIRSPSIAAGSLPAIEVNYGGFENTQLHVMLPLGFAANGPGTKFGAADVELGAKYRFIEEDEQGWRPQVATYPVVEIPLEPARNGFASRSVDTFLPVWAQKDLDANWTIDGGGGIWITPGDRNTWITGILLQRKLNDSLVAGAEIFHRTPDVPGGPALTGFNLGAIYGFDEYHHLLVSAGRGLRNANATDQFTWYLGFKLTN